MEIDPAGARALAARAGFPERPRNDGKTGDVKRLRGDVDRLLLYALGQKTITLDDVREIAGPAALQDDWAMTNAIEAGQGGEALRQLALVLDAGARAREDPGSARLAGAVEVPAGGAGASFAAPIEALFRTDLDLKRSGGDPRVLLERLVVELCGGKDADRIRSAALVTCRPALAGPRLRAGRDAAVAAATCSGRRRCGG